MQLGFLQLGLLFWKCWRTESRHPVRLAAEIIVPLLMFVMLAGFRVAFNLKTLQTECHFNAIPLPSAGAVPFLQGLVCNSENLCNDTKTRSEDGRYPFGPTLITSIIRETDVIYQKLTYSPSDLLIDGSFVRLMRQLVIARDIFLGRGMPPLLAARMGTLNGIWSLLCDRPFTMLNKTMSSSSSSSPFGGFGGGGNSQTTTSAPILDECSAFISQFQLLKPLWNAIAPILQGKIVFYPDTPIVRSLMQRVENALDWETVWQTSTQKGIELIQQAANNYNSAGSSSVQTQLTSSGVVTSADAQWIMTFINSPEYTELLQVHLPNFIRKLDCFRSTPPYYPLSTGNITSATTSTSSSTVGAGGSSTLPPVGFVTNRLEGYNSVDSLITQSMAYTASAKLLGAVEFKDPNQLTGLTLPDLVRYAIRLDPSKLDPTKEFKSKAYDVKVRRDPAQSEMPYFTTGFIYLQDAVEKSIMALKSNSVYTTIGTIMQQFPFPCYMLDQFVSNLATSLLLFVVLGWIFPAAMIVKSVVLEKEHKLREVARIMGISPGLHFLSWFLFWMTVLIISVILFVLLIRGSGVFVYTNPGIIFLIMVTYGASVISFGFFISAFFSKANVGAVVGGLAYFMTYNAYGAIGNGNAESLTYRLMMATSIMPNVALGFGWNVMGRYEMTTEGSQASNFRVPLTDEAEDQYTLFSCWIMLVIDSFVYYFIAWYVEYVFPGEYGVPRPFYFILLPSFWCGDCCRASSSSEKTDLPSKTKKSNGPFLFEDEPTHLTLGATLESIVKIYDFSIIERLKLKCGGSVKQQRKAVDDFSLNMYEGQITALLGHNGAGKTTTMSIMCGMIAATSGSVVIDGHDISTEIEEARKVLGICPQFNVLYDDLTVAEHLYFYARIRGIEKSVIREDTERMLKDTNLTVKRNEPVKTLSGGMRRRLSIAVAFIGKSKVVILDEPTAGVDPYARRSLWDLLSKFRAGRTIILSTHHMDEAEILADRIAVMSQGRLQTCGSPLFLKETCGDGYQLTVIRANRGEVTVGVSESDKKWEATVSDYVKRQIPNSGLVDHINGELHYRLGYDMVPKFTSFLGALEKSKNELGISDLGISDSTMEEIFIKMADMADAAQADGGKENAGVENDGEENEEQKPSSSQKGQKRSMAVTIAEIPKVPPLPNYEPATGPGLTTQQFWALLVKRYHRMRRNWKGFISELLLPIAFVLLGVAIIKMAEYKPGNAPTLEMQPWLMQPNSKSTREQRLYMFVNQLNNRNTTNLSRDVNAAAVRSDYGGGCRCMDPSVYKIDDYACSLTTVDSEWGSTNDRYRQRSCQCSNEGVQKCTPTDSVDPRNIQLPNYGNVDYRLLRTTDDILNLTGMDVSSYIVHQYSSLKANFYGGFSYLTTPAQDITMVPPSTFTSSSGLVAPSAVMVWFNNKGYLSTVGYNNYANNILYRLTVNNSGGANPLIPDITRYGIVGYNQPLNYTKEQFLKELTRSVLIDVMLAIMLILALSFVPASFVMFLIEDRVSDSKHVQIVSGLRPAVYWFGNYTWDCINFLVPSIVCLIIFVAFNLQAYTNAKSIGALFLLFIMYGFAVAPMLYPCSFFLDTPSTAFVLLACANLFIGAGTTVATWFLDLFTTMDASIADVNDILKRVFFIFPQYCLGRGLINMATSYRQAQGSAYFLGKSDFLENHKPFEWSVCGQFFFALALHLAGWFLIVLIIEYRMSIFRCCVICSRGSCAIGESNSVSNTPEPSGEDPDVSDERRAVMNDDGGPESPYTMLVKKLTKVFRTSRGRMTATNKLTFGVHNGHCFGLLGVNGAGKSTTFNMLTGRLLPTSGSATIRGFDILGARNDANKLIGYCPQYDCITPLLTGRENLEFFARLRGVPEKYVKETATCNITRMDLLRHADKPAGTYSGGNKRKLSAAIALTGEPPLVFLDEPTAGMDPRARRFLWRAISSLLLNGQSVVLTTHSMDECEALCTRLAIMVNGEFRCIGTTQHLKKRFGEGYLVNLRFKSEQRLASNMTLEFETARKALADKFKDVRLKEAHDNVAVYSIGASGREPIRLGELFGFLTNSSSLSSLKISEFSVMQSSLDAVFVTFAKSQASDLSDAERKKLAETGGEKGDNDSVSDIEARSRPSSTNAKSKKLATSAV